MEELLESDDTTLKGTELAVPGNRRFASDPLRFTGIDLGGGAKPRNVYDYQQSDDGDSTEEASQATSEEEEDSDDENAAVRKELEEALVQSALSRIRKAQAKGKQDVKLNKEELAALDRRRKRLQAEAAAKKRNGGDRKRKEKEQRYAVPLSDLDPDAPIPRAGPSGSSESLSRSLSRRALPPSEQTSGPPMGRFPPPSTSRPRLREGTSTRSKSSVRDISPFDYQYVHPDQRKASDTSLRSASRAKDPFQYQTEGPRAAYADNGPTNSSDAAGYGSVSRRPIPHTVRSTSRRHGAREVRNEADHEDETTSDDGGAAGERVGRGGDREDNILADRASHSPEHERPKSKKSSSHTQPPTTTTSAAAKRKSSGAAAGKRQQQQQQQQRKGK